MVVKMLASRGTVFGTLRYNQNKVAKGVADIIGSYNFDNNRNTIRDFERTFARYERMNIRTENISFQMAINPNPDVPSEQLSDSDALAFAKELMQGLGFNEQPVIVYKHKDIDRVHYHVVSIKTNKKGRKIKDSFSELKLQKLLKKLSKKYHYVIGNEEKKKKLKIPTWLRFNTKAGNVTKQYKALFDEALTYKFTTFKQFQTIMEGMGVNVKLTEGNDFHLIFQGLDDKGEKSTKRISEITMKQDLYLQMEDRIQENKVKRPLSEEENARRLATLERVDLTTAYCLQHAKNIGQYQRILSNVGIQVGLSRTPDGGIFGITFVDKESKTAYKGSELKRHFSLSNLTEKNDFDIKEDKKINLSEDKKQIEQILQGLRSQLASSSGGQIKKNTKKVKQNGNKINT